MRAAIYLRVSTEEQAEQGHSIDAQLRLARQFCKRKGWQVVRVYQDKGWSARTLRRPALQDMLADAHAGLFDVIVIHRLDRLSRSLSDMLKLVSEWTKIKITFASVTEDFDFTSPIGKVLLALLGAFAQYFIDNLREETKKGKRERAMKGYYNGGLPFGYQRVSKEHGGVPTIHKENIKGYRMAIRMTVRGASARQVVRALNAAGYRTTGNWGRRSFSVDTLLPILRNRFYLGEVYYKGEWFSGKHTAAIDHITWAKCQQMLKNRAWKIRRSDRPSQPYPLQRLLRCAHCGRTLRGGIGKDGRRYRDPSKDYGETCIEQETTKAERLEQQIFEFFASLELISHQEQNLRGSNHQIAETSKFPATTPSRFDNQLERVRRLYILGDLSYEEYLQERAFLYHEFKPQRSERDSNSQHDARLLMRFRERWTGASREEQNSILHTLMKQAWVSQGKIIRLELRLPLHKLLVQNCKRKPLVWQNIIITPPDRNI